jgi:quercetin dioxygenase-like cupin family protein
MSEITRRTLCLDLGLALAALGLTNVADAQTGAVNLPASLPKTQNALQTPLDHCSAFLWEQLPTRLSDAGAVTHDILQGTAPVAGGYLVEMHETTLEPGKAPHPPHQHPHVEFVMMRQGSIDFMMGEKHVTLTDGSVGYAAPNERHGILNTGTTTAIYYIVSLNKKPA